MWNIRVIPFIGLYHHNRLELTSSPGKFTPDRETKERLLAVKGVLNLIPAAVSLIIDIPPCSNTNYNSLDLYLN